MGSLSRGREVLEAGETFVAVKTDRLPDAGRAPSWCT
jgi:hypothetical protein